MGKDFQSTLIFGILVVLVAAALWYYWNYTKAYAGFPSESFLKFITEVYVFRRKPKHVSFLSCKSVYVYEYLILLFISTLLHIEASK